ncbi:complement C1q and tumor necrosis factor-related protein 9-like [Patiria miniata]|uniref:C1q domain-containing protein n=1 Tax=Patiria miniata TaxID=46514 RepID=A0A914BM85_PATMI|nr:complement C1q and tumor necrosis factor-related protein 9-like [Patiria miniata]
MNICVTTILSIALLLGNSVKLRASVTGPVPSGGDGPASQECQQCCQGPAAIPGIPGLPGPMGQMGPYGQPGSKGDAGQQGLKGEIGPFGPMGERGAPGNNGSKGNDGLGLPGKIGQRGLPGFVGGTGETGVKGQKGEIGPIGPMGERGAPGNTGSKGDDGIGLPSKIGPDLPGFVAGTGETGVKGQKGEPGETSDDSNQRVAFTVVRTSNSDTSSSHDTRLPFQEAKTLLPGTSFDLETGTFTCSVPGTYVFTFSVLKHANSGEVHIHLVKNDYKAITTYGQPSQRGQMSGSAVLVLKRGDTVYLTMRGRVYGDSTYDYTSFSGFLLYSE